MDFDIGGNDEEIELKGYTFSINWEYDLFRDIINIDEALDVFGDDVTNSKNKISLIKDVLRSKHLDQIEKVKNELSSKLPDPEDIVKCWRCKGEGEHKESRYHNRKVIVECNKCDGSGKMEFKEVPENGHRKKYL